MTRYWLTAKPAPKSPSPSFGTLSNGWTTTQLMLRAAQVCHKKHADHGWTTAELEDAIRFLIVEHNILFLGQTTDAKDYKDDAERIRRGRFGDMRRGGWFQDYPPPTGAPIGSSGGHGGPGSSSKATEQLSLA